MLFLREPGGGQTGVIDCQNVTILYTLDGANVLYSINVTRITQS